jgi:hypothetical protein
MSECPQSCRAEKLFLTRLIEEKRQGTYVPVSKQKPRQKRLFSTATTTEPKPTRVKWGCFANAMNFGYMTCQTPTSGRTGKLDL